MNDKRQVEVHYIDNGFPYTVIQSFMDLFEGLSYAQANVALVEVLQDQHIVLLQWICWETSSHCIFGEGQGRFQQKIWCRESCNCWGQQP
ncbi:E3 ubiquitin ligase BIG BROTHER-like [Iris pallida]|uniref:E3 ubiquitin ligase BIG BROTHER-like n=1 Tax=Iris pallida TaxID=29817 RepID=A0AAX6FJQ0_IRIPA|nr:E3 ubiquitin ligase BIG BROTHER-like [Iris pallida]